MAIKIDGNFVCVGGFCFCETPTGLEFDGEAQSTLFCDLTPLTGSSFGYIMGGRVGPPFTDLNDYQKFPFASDTNTSCVGGMTGPARANVGNFSKTHGYSSGGEICNDRMEKFPFAGEGNLSDIAELARPGSDGASHGNLTTGFISGFNPSKDDVIQSFPFSIDTNSSDVGEMTASKSTVGGSSSPSDGYVLGGKGPQQTPTFPTFRVNCIEKFPFASVSSIAVGVDIEGNLSEIRTASSDTDTYMAGGGFGCCPPPTGVSEAIRKFPFASDVNSTDIAELARPSRMGIGASSTTDGYLSGGYTPGLPCTTRKEIQKWPFASDAPATDIGCIVQLVGNGLYRAAGAQV